MAYWNLNSPPRYVIVDNFGQYNIQMFGDTSEENLRHILREILGPLAVDQDSGDDGTNLGAGRNRRVPHHVVVQFTQGPDNSHHIAIGFDVYRPVHERDLDEIFNQIKGVLVPFWHYGAPEQNSNEPTLVETFENMRERFGIFFEKVCVRLWRNMVEVVRVFFGNVWMLLRDICRRCARE